MDKYEIGKQFKIHSYKHDGAIHRSWDEAVLLEDDDDFLIFGNNKAQVQESDGRMWRTKEPAVLFFYKNKWFNIIGQKKSDGIYYYCNMASPFIIEDGTIKYIDYDLDLRVFRDESYKVLDRSEYKFHKEQMNYPEEIDKILKDELNTLIKMVKEKKGPFDRPYIEEYYKKYEKIKEKTK